MEYIIVPRSELFPLYNLLMNDPIRNRIIELNEEKYSQDTDIELLGSAMKYWEILAVNLVDENPLFMPFAIFSKSIFYKQGLFDAYMLLYDDPLSNPFINLEFQFMNVTHIAFNSFLGYVFRESNVKELRNKQFIRGWDIFTDQFINNSILKDDPNVKKGSYQAYLNDINLFAVSKLMNIPPEFHMQYYLYLADMVWVETTIKLGMSFIPFIDSPIQQISPLFGQVFKFYGNATLYGINQEGYTNNYELKLTESIFRTNSEIFERVTERISDNPEFKGNRYFKKGLLALSNEYLTFADKLENLELKL